MEQAVNQEEVLKYIKHFLSRHGYPPTQREMAGEFYCSVSTINVCMREMMEEGILKTDHPTGSRRAYRVAGMRMIDTRELEGAVKQLGDLLDHCRDMAAGRDADPIWGRDVEALEMVIEAIRTKRKQDGTNH